MARDNPIQHDIVGLQHDLFRLAERDHGLTVPRLSRLTRIPETTLRTYSQHNSDTAMPLWAFIALAAHLPDCLTSTLFEPIGKVLRSTEGEGCFDELAAAAAAYQAEHITARNDNSPGGPAIVHVEKLSLVKQARRVRDAADAVIVAHGGVA